MMIRAGNPAMRTQATACRGYVLADWIKAIGRALKNAAGCESARLAEAGIDLKSLDAPTWPRYLAHLERDKHLGARSRGADAAIAMRRTCAGRAYRTSLHERVREIPYLLGFPCGSSFTQAFRRWTGQSPSNWRALATAP
jgi:AraC-like DNA-binding protein